MTTPSKNAADLRAWRLISIPVGLGALVGGVALALHLWPSIPYQRASLEWPTVAAQITRSELVTKTVGGRNKRPRLAYCAQLAYSYSVGDQQLVADTYRLDGVDCTESGDQVPGLRARISRFSVGSQVRVYYDPEARENACLAPGLTDDAVVGFCFAIFVALTGLLGALSGAFPARRIHVVIGGAITALAASVTTGLALFYG